MFLILLYSLSVLIGIMQAATVGKKSGCFHIFVLNQQSKTLQIKHFLQALQTIMPICKSLRTIFSLYSTNFLFG